VGTLRCVIADYFTGQVTGVAAVLLQL